MVSRPDFIHAMISAALAAALITGAVIIVIAALVHIRRNR